MGDDARGRVRAVAALIAIAGAAGIPARAAADLIPLPPSPLPAPSLPLLGTSSSVAATQVAVVARTLVFTIDDVRAGDGLAPIATSTALAAAARTHALSMARKGYFSHRSADGTPFWKRILASYPAAGYRSWRAGENLYWSAAANVSAAGVAAAWLASPEHRRILLGAWAEVGIAIVQVHAAPGVFHGRDIVIAVADFGRRVR